MSYSTVDSCWMDCLPSGCGVNTPQLGLSSVLGYELMSQSALASFVCHSRHDDVTACYTSLVRGRGFTLFTFTFDLV